MLLREFLSKEDLLAETLDGVWNVLRWDLEGLLDGKFRTERHDGKKFSDGEYLQAVKGQHAAGGKRFAVSQFKQDWEHHCSVYGFKTWGAVEFCPFCNASRDPKTWVRDGRILHFKTGP